MINKEILKDNLLKLYDNRLSSKDRQELANFTPITKYDSNIIVETLKAKLTENLPEIARDAHELILNLVINTDFNSEAYKIYYQRILPIFEKLYSNLSQNGKNKLLQILAMMNVPKSLAMFVEFVTDPSCDDNYDIYRSIKTFIEIDEECVDILFPALNKVFEYKDFRAVGVIELANQLYSDKKLTNHPLENDLSIIKAWLDNTDPSEFSYGVTGCATLSLIKDKESKKLLNLATKHPGLEVRLEAVFSQIILGIDGAKQKLEEFCLDPRISTLAIAYAVELGLYEQIEQEHQDILNNQDFILTSEMSYWLMHEREYGRPPSKTEIWDKRGIIDNSNEYLFKYYYPDSKDFNKLVLQGIGYAYLNKDNEYQVYSNSKIYQTPKEAYIDYVFEFKE